MYKMQLNNIQNLRKSKKGAHALLFLNSTLAGLCFFIFYKLLQKGFFLYKQHNNSHYYACGNCKQHIDKEQKYTQRTIQRPSHIEKVHTAPTEEKRQKHRSLLGFWFCLSFLLTARRSINHLLIYRLVSMGYSILHLLCFIRSKPAIIKKRLFTQRCTKDFIVCISFSEHRLICT